MREMWIKPAAPQRPERIRERQGEGGEFGFQDVELGFCWLLEAELSSKMHQRSEFAKQAWSRDSCRLRPQRKAKATRDSQSRGLQLELGWTLKLRPHEGKLAQQPCRHRLGDAHTSCRSPLRTNPGDTAVDG